MDAIGITVKEALDRKLLGNSELIAGEKGLNRIITRVNIMEVPDIINWVKPGEFLFTTVYSIKDDVEAQKALVPALNKRGLAAIGIKPGRYIKEIPESMIKSSDELGFPLIKLPYEVSFPDLMMPILKEIFDKQASYLQRLDDVHKKLMNVVIDGGGLKEITITLSDLLKAPVIVREEIFGRSYYSSEEIKNIYEELEKNLVYKEKTTFEYALFEVQYKDNKINVLKVPIMAAKQNYGEILVFEKNEISNFEITIIERVSTILAFCLTKEIAAKEVEMKYKCSFVDDILSSNEERRKSAIERGVIYGFDLNKKYVVMLLKLLIKGVEKNPIHENSAQEKLKNRVFNAINHFLKEKGTVIAAKMDTVIILLPVPSKIEENDYEIKKYTKTCGEILLNRIKNELPDVDLMIAVGRFYRDAMEIYKSFQDAEKALVTGGALNIKNKVIHFDDLGIFRLLIKNYKEEEIEKFYKDYINPLVNYDEKHGTELLKTLESYFENNGNLKQVSKVLYTHYNTVIYRIRKVQEILGVDLKDAKDRLNVEVALQIYKILKRHA